VVEASGECEGFLSLSLLLPGEAGGSNPTIPPVRGARQAVGCRVPRIAGAGAGATAAE
jgi:hypothetical protein